MRTVVMMAAMVAVLAAFVVVDADARLAASWMDERGFGHMIEVGGKPYITIGYSSAYLVDYADPVHPMIVSTVSELYGFPFVDDFEKDGRTYVATTGATNDLSITFIDVTDIYRPEIVSKVSYGDEGFDSLVYGASNLATIEKSGRTYAITFADAGILVMDITSFDRVTPVAYLGYASWQNNDKFTFASTDMNIVELDGRTYLLAPTEAKTGTPAVDITDPLNPKTAGSPLFYADGINVLYEAWSIDVFEKDGRTYAVAYMDKDIRNRSSVEFKWDNAVIMDITDPASVTWVSNFEAYDRSKVRVHEIGGSTYVVAVGDSGTGYAVNGVISDITNPAHPRTVSTLDTNNNGGMLEILETGGKTYLVAEPRVRGSPGLLDTFDITDPANPIEVVHTLGGGYYAEEETRDVAIAEIGDRTYAMAAGHDERGAVQIIDITSPAHPIPAHAIFHEMEGFEGLYRAWGIDITHIEGRSYAVVAGEYDGGSVQIIDVTNPKVPRPVSIATDEKGGFGHLADPWDVATAEIDGRHYAVTASRGDNAVQIIDITNPSSPRPAGHIGTDTWPQQVKVAELNGRQHAIVMTSRDSSIQVIDISNPRNPVITDSSGTGDALSLDVTTMDGRTYAVVAGRVQGGGHLTIKDVTNPESVVSAGKLTIPWGDTSLIAGQGFGYGAGAEGSHAFFTGGDGTYYIDISNGLPEIVAKNGQPGSRAAVHVADGVPYALTFSTYGTVMQAYDYPGKVYHVDGMFGVPAINMPADAVFAVIDGHNGFETLAGANSIAAIKTHDTAYVIAGGSEGIQVINVDDPYHPSPVTDITDISVLDMQLVNDRYLVAETIDGVMAFDVIDPASPVQIVVNTGLTDISSGDDVQRMDSDVIYLSGESRIASVYSDGSIKVARGFDIDTQRLNSLMMVENATAAALARIGGTDYGMVAVVGHYPNSDYDVLYEQKSGNLLVYDTTDPHNIVKVAAILDNPSQDFTRDPQHLETLEVAGRHYAVGMGTYSFTIIDVTDPLNPVGTSGGGGSANNFRAATGATDFDLMVVDGRLYGLLASPDNNGIQITDITYLVERR